MNKQIIDSSETDTEILDTDDVSNQCVFEELVENNISKEIHIVENNKRISRNLLTSYEMVRIIGERQKQLTMGAKPMISHDKSLTYEDIAIQELILNVIPFKIKRQIQNHYEIDLDFYLLIHVYILLYKVFVIY